MQCFSEKLRAQLSHAPKIMPVKSEDLLADTEMILYLDLREVTPQDLNTNEIDHFAVATRSGKCEGICLYFICYFPSELDNVALSTEPGTPNTHWKQTLIVLPASVEIEKDCCIPYHICLKRLEESGRKYRIEVEMLDPDAVEHPYPCMCNMTKCILAKAVLEQYMGN